ncbi:hypothetical protein IFE09_33455 [Streptomyces microflavus]|uniref:hypothetical protein n=1 Tax=Streptomyces microflavus TaxID=1919 RepID=UPI00192ADCA7|nr:hypothetical protein [Streptomyces microflavus]QQZ57884.1 hypothetical protein IFE09_33455 [Streptomyces microflavus]
MARTVDSDRLRTAPADALAALPLVAYGEELPILRRYWRSEFGHRPTNPVALVAPDLRAVPALTVVRERLSDAAAGWGEL